MGTTKAKVSLKKKKKKQKDTPKIWKRVVSRLSRRKKNATPST